MDIFKLFKKVPQGREMMKAPTPNADEKTRNSELIWQNFWGCYDAVMELGCLRQSININPDHADAVEQMFVCAIDDLVHAGTNLVNDYQSKKVKEEPNGS